MTKIYKSYGVETKYPIPKLKKIFDKYRNKEDWRNPVDAMVPTEKEALVLAEAIRFYQADAAKIQKVSVPVRHREGLVFMQGTAYNVTSRGYQAW